MPEGDRNVATRPSCHLRPRGRPSLDAILQRVRRLLLVALVGMTVTSVRADAIVQVRAMTASTIAEYFVDEPGVRVELEVGLSDLPGFRNLLPDCLYAKLGYEPRPLEQRLLEFFARDLPVSPMAGVPIRGRVSRIELRDRVRRDEITGEALPAEDDPEKTVFAELFYPFETRPEGLILSGPSGPTAASIGFVVYHRGLPVNDFRYLALDYQLDLDWRDPWYSRFRNRNLRRAYDAPMSGFIYVEPYEVRKEIIARPKDLQEWIDLGLEGASIIPAEVQPELMRRVADFLRRRHRVVIDGREIEPELARINFLRRTLRNSTVVDSPEDLDTISATLGVIFVYPTDGLPERVTMEWDLFHERIERVPVAAVDQAGPLPSVLTPDDPLLVWDNFLTNPVLPTLVATEAPPGTVARTAIWLRWLLGTGLLATLVTAVAQRRRQGNFARSVGVAAVVLLLLTASAFWLGRDARLSEAHQRQIVSALLHNVYRAFDFRDEERIYDVLERSVTGDLLTRIYLDTRRGLEIRNQGGARAKVKDLKLVELETGSGVNGGFVARVVWDVSGSVGHWGHVHRRTNRYHADLGIEPVGRVWKLTSLQMLEEERLPTIGRSAEVGLDRLGVRPSRWSRRDLWTPASSVPDLVTIFSVTPAW